ncbi:MAG TPA: type II toxin-antitoxin system VapC family toxin [Melioribacteraceae bacterium]|nr:type II toxin-antitoxin system VapC family toxin [Melioribacteraceae bacterium]
MNVAVNDANIIIDLIDLDLYLSIFNLDIEFLTTDFVISEIKRKDQADIIKKSNKLNIIKSDEKDLLQILEYKNKAKQLSFADCSVIYLSQKNKAILLSGDKPVRNFAEANGMECHGILWLIDTLVNNNVITKYLAIQKLKELNCRNNRLPQHEIEKLIIKLNNLAD